MEIGRIQHNDVQRPQIDMELQRKDNFLLGIDDLGITSE